LIELKAEFEAIAEILPYEQSGLEIDYTTDSPDHKIGWVIYPHTQDQLSRAIALAHAHKVQILICGNGSKLNWGGLVNLTSPTVIISTVRLNKLIEHAVGDLTVTCEAGIKFTDLQEILARSGQFLAIDPAYPAIATMGGILATASTGSLRQRYGGVRDICLGVSFVRADGKLVKAGGRVVKNVAGYDLMKLLTGSFGSLGVISQVTFRVYPLPESDRTILLTGNPKDIATAQNQILTSALTPIAIDIVSDNLISGQELGLMVRFAGISQGVEEQTKRLLSLAQQVNLKAELLPTTIWQDLQNLICDRSNHHQVICKIGILPAQAVSTLLAIQKLEINPYLQIHASSGLGTLRCDFDNLESFLPCLLKVRELANATGGFLTILAAPMELKQHMDVWGYTGNAIAVIKALKYQFDPNNLLNPSRFL
jgi:glycolate oxidase FAD binding subunit